MDDYRNQNDVPNYQPLNIPDEEPPQAIPLEPIPQMEEQDAFWITDAVIEEITLEQDITYVTVSYQEEGRSGTQPIQVVKLVVSDEYTRLFDQERRAILPVDLDVGMVIDALISSRMTMSNPPQAKTFQILVVSAPLSRVATTGNIVQVNVRNNFLLIAPSDDPKNILRINFVPETVILNVFGRRISLADLYPGITVRVEHEQFMTASIPPQTTGYIIQIIKCNNCSLEES